MWVVCSAQCAWVSFLRATGLFTTGDVRLTLLQVVVALVAMAYSAAMTWVIAILLEKTLGWRVSTYTEMTGIDLAQHGERSYDLTGTALHFETRVLKNQKG